MRKGPQLPAADGSLEAFVRRAIAASLADGRTTLTGVATTAGLSVRSLQRRLTAKGLTHSQLRDEVRRDTAYRLIEDSDFSLSQVAPAQTKTTGAGETEEVLEVVEGVGGAALAIFEPAQKIGDPEGQCRRGSAERRAESAVVFGVVRRRTSRSVLSRFAAFVFPGTHRVGGSGGKRTEGDPGREVRGEIE